MFKGPIALGTIRTSFVLGLRLVVQAGTLLLVAYMLEPEGFGVFAGIASLAVLLGALSSFGTQLVLLGEVSKEPSRRDDVLSCAIPTTLLCGSSLLVFYVLIATWLIAEVDVAIQVLLSIGITEILLQPLLGLMVSEHHGLGRIARAQLLQLLPMVFRLAVAGIVSLLHLHSPLVAYTAGYATATVIALAFGATTLPTRWPSCHCWRLLRRKEWGEAAGYAAINISRAGPAELDKTLALKLLPLGAAGVYAAGARVVGAIVLPVTAMTLSALPLLFREGKTNRTRNLLSLMYGAAFVYSFLLACVLWLVTPLFDAVFGGKYQGIGEVIRWLCISIPGMAMRLVAGNSLMALERPWMRAAFETMGWVILIAVSSVLTIRFGAVGLPLALALSEWSMAIVGGLLVYCASQKSA